jgi:tRNA pseudouridine38-40 synthase
VRFKLTIEYNGTRYSGWQRQKNARTVAGEVERSIEDATGVRDFELYGSGRTDAGVHALRQVAHLEIRVKMPPATLRARINEALPADIAVLDIAPAARTFHARHDAVARSYLYQVSRRKSAFAKPFVWWVKDPLDLGAMRQAAARFVGFHDFRHFADDDPDEKSTTVHLETLDLYEDGDLILIHVEGSHFLWKMVRRLVGVLVEVGRGHLSADDAGEFLRTADGLPARLTAPAAGLFLERVYYAGDRRDPPVHSAVVVAGA